MLYIKFGENTLFRYGDIAITEIMESTIQSCHLWSDIHPNLISMNLCQSLTVYEI